MKKVLLIVLCLILLAGCSKQQPSFTDQSEFMDIEDEAVALSEAPSTTCSYKGEHPGVSVKQSKTCEIDYSNIKDGYVMVHYIEAVSQKIKVQVKGPNTTYSYNLTPTEWTTFSLSDGNGKYTVAVYKNVSGTKYANECSVSFDAKITDAYRPYLISNQYVNFANANSTVAKAKELTSNCKDELEMVKSIYDYVVVNFTYDKELAQSVQSGYLPDLDKVLEKKKGICFDYAALMAGMLRSQYVPTKLVVGYAGTAYHAWINVYVNGQGWINNAIYFDGSTWNRMDPTFASSAKESEAIMKYIGDGANYKEKYLY